MAALLPRLCGPNLLQLARMTHDHIVESSEGISEIWF